MIKGIFTILTIVLMAQNSLANGLYWRSSLINIAGALDTISVSDAIKEEGQEND